MPEVNYFWDPLSDNILQERDETGTVTAEYTTEPAPYGNLISQNRGGTESQCHFDALGSTLALTDDNQQVTDTYAYTAFGEVTERTGITINPFQYVGQKGYGSSEVRSDILVRRRWLSTQFERWGSSDPLPGNYGVSGYSYSHNRPTSLTDPSGACCCCCVTQHFGYVHRDLLRKDPENEIVTLWGHYVHFVATLDIIVGPGTGRGCRFEWWECPSLGGSLGQRPNEWNRIDIHPEFKKADTNWHDYYDGTLKFVCPDTLRMYLKDEPKLNFPTSRTVKFAFRLVSEAGCPCMFPTIWGAFTQTLEAERGARIDPATGLPKGVIKWVIESGIDDQKEPKACTKAKFVEMSGG